MQIPLHIIPLEEDEDKKLDNQNLITLCERHHEMAEQGKIPREELLAITAEIYPPQGAKFEFSKRLHTDSPTK